jgi:hypothetical protein
MQDGPDRPGVSSIAVIRERWTEKRSRELEIDGRFSWRVPPVLDEFTGASRFRVPRFICGAIRLCFQERQTLCEDVRVLTGTAARAPALEGIKGSLNACSRAIQILCCL